MHCAFNDYTSTQYTPSLKHAWAHTHAHVNSQFSIDSSNTQRSIKWNSFNGALSQSVVRLTIHYFTLRMFRFLLLLFTHGLAAIKATLREFSICANIKSNRMNFTWANRTCSVDHFHTQFFASLFGNRHSYSYRYFDDFLSVVWKGDTTIFGTNKANIRGFIGCFIAFLLNFNVL